MNQGMREADWKVFRKVQPLALDRFCARVLKEVSGIVADTGHASPDRYRAVYRLMRDRDEELAAAFDNPRRSSARIQLARIVPGTC